MELEKFDFNFPVTKNPSQLKSKYEKTIRKMRSTMENEEDSPAQVVRGGVRLKRAITEIVRTTFWNSHVTNGKGNQAHVNKIKRAVNNAGHIELENCMKVKSWPKSWATAFYAEYMDSMDEILQSIVVGITESIWEDYFEISFEQLMKVPESQLSTKEIGRKINYIIQNDMWEIENTET